MSEGGINNQNHLEVGSLHAQNITLTGTFNSNLDVNIASSATGIDGSAAITATISASPTGQTFSTNTLNIIDVTRTATDVYGFQLPLLSASNSGDIIRVMFPVHVGTSTSAAQYDINVASTDAIYGTVLAKYMGSAFVAQNGSVLGDQEKLVACNGKGKISLKTGVIHFGGEAGTEFIFINRNKEVWEVSGQVVMGIGNFAHEPVIFYT
jgi:hypothetical protein